MNQVEETQNQFISQLNTSSYTNVVPKSGEVVLAETKQSRRRRKRKNKNGEDNGDEGGAKKRTLSDEQVKFLEMSFANDHRLETERKDKLAIELGLEPTQVAVWFQNKRARWKNQKLEEAYSKLQKAHESVVVEKCHLENEVLNLKEKLSEAESEIRKLLERSDGVSISSPSSVSMNEQQYVSEFMVEGIGSVFCVPDYSYVQEMGWGDFYDF